MRLAANEANPRRFDASAANEANPRRFDASAANEANPRRFDASAANEANPRRFDATRRKRCKRRQVHAARSQHDTTRARPTMQRCPVFGRVRLRLARSAFVPEKFAVQISIRILLLT
jgi:hypothetical protein